MNHLEIQSLAAAFCPTGAVIRSIEAIGEGNINDTYLVIMEGSEEPFVFQKINKKVFPQPEAVIVNAEKVFRHLSQKQLPMVLLVPIPLSHLPERFFVTDAQGDYWRAFQYISGTVSHPYASTPMLAFEASRAMGYFLSGLCDLEPSTISEVIPHFHDGVWRFCRFEEAVSGDIAGRREESSKEIAFALEEQGVFHSVERAAFPRRVVHNDAKMGNFLFDAKSATALAVIDWDTTMPGAIVSDFGDMVRTMAASLSEDDDRFEQVVVRRAWFEALVKGFLPPLKGVIRPEEVEGLLLGAKWIILEQMIRFLGDYLNGDTYYKVRFPKHNLIRARNQMALYQSLLEQESDLEEIIRNESAAYF